MREFSRGVSKEIRVLWLTSLLAPALSSGGGEGIGSGVERRVVPFEMIRDSWNSSFPVMVFLFLSRARGLWLFPVQALGVAVPGLRAQKEGLYALVRRSFPFHDRFEAEASREVFLVG